MSVTRRRIDPPVPSRRQRQESGRPDLDQWREALWDGHRAEDASTPAALLPAWALIRMIVDARTTGPAGKTPPPDRIAAAQRRAETRRAARP
ncbi:MAG: hypothetical protein AAGB15_07810 [Pseudomonadota bacterium]